MLSFHLPLSFPCFGWCECNVIPISAPRGGRITAVLLMGLQDRRDVAKCPTSVTKDTHELWRHWGQLLTKQRGEIRRHGRKH